MIALSTLRGVAAVCAVSAFLWGCSSSNSGSNSGSSVTAESHQDGWISSHGEAVVSGNTTCVECHGSSLNGGSAEVACNSCHGPNAPLLASDPDLAALFFSSSNDNMVARHVTDWESAEVTDTTIPFYTFQARRHGYVAKADPSAPRPVGFGFCADCHTDSFTGQPLPSPLFSDPSANCVACHGNGTPHHEDLAEWGPPGYHHITTDPNNAGVCAKCHASGNPPSTLSNGCFNGMLCHTGDAVTNPLKDHFEGHWDFHKQGPEACIICHGEPTVIDGRMTLPGQGAAPRCIECHGEPDGPPACETCHGVPPTATSGKKVFLKRK